jgi:hypothetical protein
MLVEPRLNVAGIGGKEKSVGPDLYQPGQLALDIQIGMFTEERQPGNADIPVPYLLHFRDLNYTSEPAVLKK